MSQTLTLEPHSIKSPQDPFDPEILGPASLHRLVDTNTLQIPTQIHTNETKVFKGQPS